MGLFLNFPISILTEIIYERKDYIMSNNSNIVFKRELPTPDELKKEIPISEKIEEIKNIKDKEIADVFRGKSDKLILIIGPCSADRMDSVFNKAKSVLESEKIDEENKSILTEKLQSVKTKLENQKETLFSYQINLLLEEVQEIVQEIVEKHKIEIEPEEFFK